MSTTSVIEVPRALCIQTRYEMEERIRAAVAGGEPVVEIDLARTEAVDGAGVGVLLWARTLARAAGVTLRFVAPSPAIRSFLSGLEIFDEFEFYQKPRRALQAV